MKILKYVGHSVFQNYVKTCRPFSFSELLTGKFRTADRQKFCIIKI